MKSYRAIFATIFLAASCVAADAASISTRGRYEFDQNMLRDPRALNWNIEQCSHYGLKPALLRKLAELMDVSPANARHEFCRRILTATAKGAIPYEDYVRFAQKHIMSAGIAKALQLSGTRAANAKPLRHQSEGPQ